MASGSVNKQNREKSIDEAGPVTWWSWRPGIQPQNAILLGVPFTLLALIFILLGLLTLVAGIVDSMSPPLLVAGTVRQHNAATVISPPQLTIELQGPKSIPAIVTFAVSTTTFQQIRLKAPVTVSYSQHLHFAYALEYVGHHYTIPGSSAAGNPIGSIALLLLGFLLFPYPALLAHWGWQDLLLERYTKAKPAAMKARVVNKRATSRMRTARPGFAGRGSRPWYGLALLPLDDTMQQVSTFSVSEEIWTRIQDDECVKITYSPHLHYVYGVQTIEE